MPRKLCQCGKRSSFALSDGKIKWCATCPDKPEGAVNVRSMKCPCGKRMHYGITYGKAEWCSKCPDKHPDAVEVYAKKCPCGKRMNYGITDGKAEWCAECPDKHPDAVHVYRKKCPCGKQKNFGLEDGKAEWCSKCPDKPEDAVDVVHKKCKCGKKMAFGITNGKAEWCATCPDKHPDAVNLFCDICPGYNGVPCPVLTYVYGDEYCTCCDPDETRRITRKRMENAFFEFANGKINLRRREYYIPYDPRETTKTAARIDGIVIEDGIVVCIEVDENGHNTYACDESRTHMASAELLQKFPGYDIAWVRVNPTIKKVKNQWTDKCVEIRTKRYEQTINAIKKALVIRETGMVFIGFDKRAPEKKTYSTAYGNY